MKFTLEIELGNDVMQSPADVARALEDVAKTLTATGLMAIHEEGDVRDWNGNTVGEWSVKA